MTKIKFCGLTRPEDIEAVNALKPDYAGFVFAQKSRRYVSPEIAVQLKNALAEDIRAVGVFVNEAPETVARLMEDGVIDMAQLHGNEDEEYIRALRKLTSKPIIQAFKIRSAEDAARAEKSAADTVLLDSGAGTGEAFDWRLISGFGREYFLAGGLDARNVSEAIKRLRPYAVDVSSGIETGGVKDKLKMAEFANNVRKENVV